MWLSLVVYVGALVVHGDGGFVPLVDGWLCVVTQAAALACWLWWPYAEGRRREVALLGPALDLTSRSLLSRSVSLAYPVFDLVLVAVVGAVAVLQRHRVPLPLLALLTGFLVYALADVEYDRRIAARSYVVGTPLDALWAFGLALMTFRAAGRPSRDSRRPDRPSRWWRGGHRRLPGRGGARDPDDRRRGGPHPAGVPSPAAGLRPAPAGHHRRPHGAAEPPRLLRRRRGAAGGRWDRRAAAAGHGQVQGGQRQPRSPRRRPAAIGRGAAAVRAPARRRPARAGRRPPPDPPAARDRAAAGDHRGDPDGRPGPGPADPAAAARRRGADLGGRLRHRLQLAGLPARAAHRRAQAGPVVRVPDGRRRPGGRAGGVHHRPGAQPRAADGRRGRRGPHRPRRAHAQRLRPGAGLLPLATAPRGAGRRLARVARGAHRVRRPPRPLSGSSPGPDEAAASTTGRRWAA